ncbi:monovalent cation/H(+) antiporter subunit G [Persicirhabdus sediminis]|uniref:Monovalent cation/H(+) antiporter subunit G n=1 Tax=Persicirhabdus sediminis TaxID=454144 RepID=A0A8J7MAV8_9BACT|nr:monovalent cation/H(+) antiporter subunit G [Persicirhabdus sediminis]MBK1789606.1 monovalent cation/H(+) antiporter subunit G [Persicirhabdus sediminis]
MIAAILFLLGALMMCIATIGMLRLPDPLSRMHAGTKAASLGILLVCSSLAVHFASWEIALRAIFIVLLVFMTVPVGAHMVARKLIEDDSE